MSDLVGNRPPSKIKKQTIAGARGDPRLLAVANSGNWVVITILFQVAANAVVVDSKELSLREQVFEGENRQSSKEQRF